MSPALTAARVRGDLDVLSRAGLDLDVFLSEATDSVRRAVPWVGACVGTHDPATMMLTSARKYGALVGKNELDPLFGLIEYDSDEETAFRALAQTEHTSISLHRWTGGDLARSERMRHLMQPHFGFGDEARLLFRDGDQVWGGLAMFREGHDQPFAHEEIEFLETLSSAFAHGVRAGMLTRLAALPPVTSDVVTGGPAVVIINAAGEIAQISVGAAERLAELQWNDHSGDPLGMVSALVGEARRSLRQPDATVPRARLRTPSGVWLLLHASPLAGPDGAVGDVVVTIEEARPPEIVSLVVAAFGLSPRERDVTQLVLQGVSTKEIAAALHLSAYTVQDHLKTVFEKAGVRSRRELIARVYFDQYVPRMGTEIGPGGWFAG